MTKKIVNNYYAFIIAIIAFLADQIAKILISENMLLNGNLSIFNNVLSFTKLYNTGAAFGIFQDKIWFLSLFSVSVILMISIYLIKNRKIIDFAESIAWGLILGGTVGNFFDRMTLGYVLDFIRLDFVNFPVFNIADMCINIGAFLLIIHMIFAPQEKEQKNELA
jgi:signal peptidase II